MQRNGVLRIFTFNAAAPDSVLDGMLRDELLPGLQALPGNRFVAVGRRVVGADSQRVVVSTWMDFAAMDAALGHVASVAEYRPDIALAIADQHLDVFELATEACFGREAEIVVLRSFVGTVLPGRLREFVDEAAGPGIERLALDERCGFALVGSREPDVFAVVSGWTDWGGVADATGGDITGAVTIAHANRELIATGVPLHYELMQPPAGGVDRHAAEGPPRPVLPPDERSFSEPAG